MRLVYLYAALLGDHAMDETKKTYMTEDEGAAIEILPLLQAIWQRWWMILLVMLVFAMGAFVGTKLFVTPLYRASFTAYVNNRAETEQQTALSNADLSAARYLTYTYAEIIGSRTVLEQAAEQAGLTFSYGQLSSMVSTSIQSNTEIISVSVTSSDPAVAKALADSVAAVATVQIASIVDGSSMRIIDDPVTPTGIYAPNYGRVVIIAAALGFLLMVAVIVLWVLLDDRLKDEESLERRFGIPILGTIPNTGSAAKTGGNYYAYGGNSGKGGSN